MEETNPRSAGDPPLTVWLQQARDGDDDALGRVWEAALSELRKLAKSKLVREIGPADLQTTEIVNECWIRMHGAGQAVDFVDRGMFYGAAWRVMGQLLIDHARTRRRKKRGGGEARQVDFAFAEGSLRDATRIGDDAERIVAAMEALAQHDSTSHAVAVMRLCFDHDRRHVALIEGIAPEEVDKRWRYARAFLRSQLESEVAP